jgi:peptidoglycan hydrolase-like protein with peptidoglycan-binding domain
MRVLLAIAVVLAGALPALAQVSPTPAKKPAAAAAATPATVAARKPAKRAAPKPAAVPAAPNPAAVVANPTPADPAAKPARAARRTAAKPVARSTIKDSYDSMPAAERTAIQSELAWTGDYNGLVDGDFSDRAIAAVKAFQKRNKSKETGILNPQERAALAAAAKPAQDHAGWRQVDDRASGARLGIPLKLAPQTAPGKSGTRWSSAQGQIQIETFRVREPGTNLQTLFDQQKKEPPGRKVEYSVLRPDFIVLGGTQGLKKFYVRAHIKDGEVRGMTVMYDQATEGIMDPVVVAMSSAFAPFGTSAVQAASPPRRRVEYASGIIVSGDGHIVTDRQVTEECQVLVISGLGNADRVADDPKAELALLRVHGARDLKSASLANDAPIGADVALVGIADPQAQNGDAAVTIVSARLGGSNGGMRVLDRAPAAGYAGAAAVDQQGRLIGMAEIKPSGGAAPNATAPQTQAMVVPVETIRTFLQAQNVAPGSGTADMAAAKAAVVRVICVRK